MWTWPFKPHLLYRFGIMCSNIHSSWRGSIFCQRQQTGNLPNTIWILDLVLIFTWGSVSIIWAKDATRSRRLQTGSCISSLQPRLSYVLPTGDSFGPLYGTGHLPNAYWMWQRVLVVGRGSTGVEPTVRRAKRPVNFVADTENVRV
jgi:hypothetical protein